MALTIREKRIKARKLGITNFRELSEDELDEAIAEARNGSSSKKKAKKVVKSATKKKRGPGRPPKVRDDYEDDEDEEDEDEDEDEVEEAPRKRGRPKGSTTKPKRRGRPPKEESAKGTTRKKKNGVGRPVGSGTGTRIPVPERIKWKRSFDFRDGSTAQYILDQLRKSAEKYTDTDDIREHTISKLEGKINKVDELTFNNRATGRPHKGEAAERMLRYRVNQTILKFCQETGQHEGSEAPERSKRGPGRPKKSEVKRGPGRPKKVKDDYEDDEDIEDEEDEDEDDEPVKKRRGRPPGSGKKRGPGRPKGSTNKKPVAKRGPGRPRKVVEEDKPRRGRPPGTKNKKKKSTSRR